MNKAREHSLLVSNRPPFVTILTLVRDAAARLPNGEGTRAEVSTMPSILYTLSQAYLFQVALASWGIESNIKLCDLLCGL